MSKAIWVLAAIAGLAWSALCWLLWAAAGAGAKATLGLARLLQVDPLELVWLADILDSIGGVAQLLVLLFWLVGMAALVLMLSLSGRATRLVRDAVTEARIAAGDPAAGHAPALEGEVRSRTVSRPPDPPA